MNHREIQDQIETGLIVGGISFVAIAIVLIVVHTIAGWMI